jgi:2-polyprenyl-3-methyl-5-hydroxy-6-metoxy-1,4-benzoquinol methylase
MVDSNYVYHGFGQPDPPHQPLYLEIMLRHLKSEPTICRVLDAGCGDGNFTASMAQAGFEMCGIDLSSPGIAKAKESYPQCRFFEGSVSEDLASACGVAAFDAIVAIEVIEHLYSPRKFVSACKSSLRPGGLLIVTTPYWGYLKNVMLAVTNRMDRALTSLLEGGHIKHWSFRTLQKLLTQQGFEFVAFHGAGRRIPYLWNGMIMVVRKPLTSE